MAMDRDPLSDEIIRELRALPPIAPPAALDAQVRQAAHAVLSGGDHAAPSLFATIVYRGLLPTLLSGITVSYLAWAMKAASALY